ncbi:MAG: porphobilinogen synthase, porphobilinogen synthase [Candidatus Dadabacteria bacterium CSP1-2]|nr:MAG: porphobilinogen synthase, porphobilinogen synthase [Candidatus Dadabacteria bacterium CSP1-2]
MLFPSYRPRRLRKTKSIRKIIQETDLSVSDFIYPMFVIPGNGVKEEITSMPGIFRYSIDNTIKEIKEIKELGIQAVLLFGIPEKKDEHGSEGYNENGIIQKALRKIKEEIKDILLITDVCMCEYTSHGHCGIVKDGEVENDETLQYLGRMALSHAKAGADIVAPSDMMDGRVGVIREVLDENGFQNVAIMSYSAKYASAFYGPFREAAHSTPLFGDRHGYQMDPPNIREALREISLDIQEGADIVMIKPALSYLDVIKAAKEEFDYPIAAYSVSGEYSMVKAAGRLGWVDETKLMMEILTSIKRAGADIIITYFAKDAASILNPSKR